MTERSEALTPPPAPAFRVGGDLLLLSGQVGVTADWQPVQGSFQDEARAAFANVRRALNSAGAHPGHIIKVTAYLADFSDFVAYNEVWSEEFPNDPPARTTVGAALHPPFRVELDVTAWLGTSSSRH
jgi:2-iminobutanoate/2-iminopropanoate deaminase